ncbi:MAG: tetratricopeptide repeat protein [Bacteroidota bacterium]
MFLKNYLLPFALLCLLAACGQAPKQPAISQNTIAIPDLLDRPEKVWYGTEWQGIQNRYAANRDNILADSNDADAHIKLAETFINEARITGEHGHYYPAALQMLNGVLSKKITDKDVLFRALATKAGVQLSLHQFPEAKASGEQAVALNPYNAQVYGVLVDANVEMGQYDAAVHMADRMMSIRPDLRSYSRVSYLREIHGDAEGAIGAMEMAVQSGHPTLEETAWAMLTLGELYQNYGDPNKAITVFETTLLHRPGHPFAIGALANIYLEKKEYERAETLLKEAMAIIPEVGFYMDLARLYKTTGRILEATKLTDEILTMLQEDLDSGHNMNLELADVYAHFKNDYETALEYALTEYRIRPENIDVNRQLALLYSEMGDWEKAAEYATVAASTNSRHPELLALSKAISMK